MHGALLLSIVLASAAIGDEPVNRFGLSTPMDRPQGTIRVATYNMLNFFDQEFDPALVKEHEDLGMVPTTLERCQKLADAIRAIDADILGVQEVESAAALQWLVSEYLDDMGYDYIASEDVGYYRDVECGILSRYPLTDVEIWPETDLNDIPPVGPGWATPYGNVPSPYVYQRSPIKAVAHLPGGYELTVMVLHHKAGRNDYHREAESRSTMALINSMLDRDPHRNILLMGDFNAAPWAKSMRVYFEGGLIDTMAHRTTYNEAPESALYRTHESGKVLDYILMSPGGIGEFIPGSSHIYGTVTPPRSYNYKTDPQPPGYAADHYPVIIDLVPREGEGTTVEVPAWTQSQMAGALAAAEATVAFEAATAYDPTQPFMGSRRSSKFHAASCSNASTITESNKVSYTSVDDATSKGRTPAKCCEDAISSGASGSASGGDSSDGSTGGTPCVASRGSKVFHATSCAVGQRISRARKVSYDTAEAAEADGKRPASCCADDIASGSGGDASGGEAACVASKSSSVYHTAECGSGQRISDANKVEYADAAAAEADGKRPAQCCHK